MKRLFTIAAVVGGLALGLQAVAFGADRAGSTSTSTWSHVQSWGDWCNFQDETAQGHGTPQTYEATTQTDWSVDDFGVVSQTVTQSGSMTTAGVTRPFRATLVTTGPASAYLEAAPLTDGGDFLDPRFFDESLDVDYTWTVPGFYAFEYHNTAGDGLPAAFGPTLCG